MDWPLAIERNRQPLLRIVVTLFAVLGLSGDAGVKALARLSLLQYRTVLAVLRPAEWAVRRLVVVVAHGLVLQPRRTAETVPASRRKPGVRKTGTGRVSFQLFDPRKSFSADDDFQYHGPVPHIRLIDATFDPRIPLFRGTVTAATDEDVNAEPLLRRLVAVKAALEDLPRQAQRYLRWKAKPFEQRRPKLASTLRPGAPPGYRGRCSREIDHIMRECHDLVGAIPWSPPRNDSS